MATNFRANRPNTLTLPSFITLAFQNGLQDRNVDVKRLHGDDFFTSDGNFVSFRPVTRLHCVHESSIISRFCFMAIRQKARTTCSRAGYMLGFATQLLVVLNVLNDLL